MADKQKFPKKEVGYLDGVLIYTFAILANLAAQVVVSIAAFALGAATGKNLLENAYFQYAGMLLFQIAFLAVPVVYYAGIRKRRPILMSPICKPKPHTAFGALIAVLCILGFILPAQYFTVLLDKIGYNFSSGVDLGTAGKFVFGFIVMVMVAPCVEELIFRGFLLSGLNKRFNKYVSAALCALAFMLMHMNPEQTVYQFCLGFICALAVTESGNLIISVIIHAVSNFIAMVIDRGFLGRAVEKALVFLDSHAVAAVFITVGLAAACGAAIWFICRFIGKLRARNEDKALLSGERTAEEVQCADAGSKRTGMIIYSAIAGLCAVMWIAMFVQAMI